MTTRSLRSANGLLVAHDGMMYHANMQAEEGARTGEAWWDWLERAGAGASLLCLIHCLALPVILAALPTLSKVLAIPESFHLWVLAFAIPASGMALWMGRTRHGTHWPLYLGILGLVCLILGVVQHRLVYETELTVLGSLTLCLAHAGNWRLRRRINRAKPNEPITA